MKKINFENFKNTTPKDFLAILNDDTLRKHLINHPYFDVSSINEWMEEKSKIDTLPNCRIRAVYINNTLAGWCGIQPDDNGAELAIVLSQAFWGYGISIFKILMGWAEELKHKEVVFHLLDSRSEYKALKRIASKVEKTELLGACFTTYHIPVEQ